MGPADTPYEAGLGFTVSDEKEDDFIGRAALRRLAAEPLSRRLVHVKLADPEPLLYHGESLLRRGVVVGRVTSGAYGHSLGAAVGLAFLDGDPDEAQAIVAANDVEIEIAGTRVPAILSKRPFYDPDGSRMRG
jgi:glycine cleavage system aminomethyltransferase T